MKLICFYLIILFGLTSTAAIDFPIKMPKTSSNYLFSEAINNQVGFSIAQTDATLADLFDPSTSPPTSNLCGPTTVANLMAVLQLVNPSAKLSLKYNPLNADYSGQVREYYNQCRTDSKSGTFVVDMAQCIAETFKESGSTDSDVKVLGPTQLPNINPAFVTAPHTIGINDIRKALKNNYAVILELQFFHPDETTNPITWMSTAGHYVLVVGYDYDESFGDTKIILKVVNPSVNYMARDPYQRFDNIEMMRFPKKAGITYPVGSDYILDGFSFKGYPNRAFVKYLITSKLHANN